MDITIKRLSRCLYGKTNIYYNPSCDAYDYVMITTTGIGPEKGGGEDGLLFVISNQGDELPDPTWTLLTFIFVIILSYWCCPETVTPTNVFKKNVY